jgi:putative nucleotidyltransferase with HDIG domain
MKNLPLKLKVYLILLYLFTVGSIVFFVANKSVPIIIPNYVDIIVFSIVLALAESLVVEYGYIAISASIAINLASIILFKPLTAIIIIVLGFSMRMTIHNEKRIHIFNTPIYKTLFNLSVVIVPTLYSGMIYSILAADSGNLGIWRQVQSILAFGITYFIINTLLTSILVSLISNKNVFYFFTMNARLGMLSNIVMAPFGVILAYMFKANKYSGVLLFLFPILLARYTFSLYIESKNQYVQTVDTLMRAMEARDKYTEGHSQRVAEIASKIAKQLKYSDIKIERLNIASLLHDVGKIGIDDHILRKPGKLSSDEFEIIKKHPEIGFNILKDIKNLENILPIVRHHHEKYDGSGYPDRKNGEELPIDVFIIQLADSIDAMATDRPYRHALTQEQILSEIKRCSGTQFHPKVVEAYLNVLREEGKAVM